MLLVAQVSVYLMDTKSKAMIPISNADRWVTDGTGNLRWKFQGNPFLFMGNVSDPPLDLVPGTCDPGQYLIPDPPQKGKPVTGRCEVCGAGYYTVEGMTGKHDTTGCTACVAGTFQSYGGATGCSSCAAGEFTDSSGRSQCLQCSKGTFQPNTSSTACEDCAPGDPLASDSERRILRTPSVTMFLDDGVCTCWPGYRRLIRRCRLCSGADRL